MSAYFYVLLGSIVFPFLLSFDKKISFYKKWKFLFPAIFLVAIVFIAWDVYFVKNGVWGFNKAYLSGLYVFNLPIEEVLFFIIIPIIFCLHFLVINFLIKEEIPFKNCLNNIVSIKKIR